jgi:protein SCO1
MSETQDKPKIAPWTIWIPIIIMALGVVVFFNWAADQAIKSKSDRPPYSHKLEQDLELIEKTGKTVRMEQLKGKVILAAHFYTTCPAGCTVLADKMKDIYDEFAPKHPGLQLVSYAIDEGDTPERLAAVAKESYDIEPTNDRWWFVTGEQRLIRAYLTLQFKFYAITVKPEKERTSPVDKYAHDMRVALVDHKANVRKLYNLMSADPELAKRDSDLLRKDLAYVLAEQEADAAK